MPVPYCNIVETVRGRVGTAVRKFLTGHEQSALERFVDADGADTDIGFFGPGSVTWQVHSDLATMVGGLRALLLQTLHPLAIAAVADHSDYRTNPLGRLHRTAAFLTATTFGSSSVAEQAIAVVRAVHQRVVGIAPDGRPYRADDPHLLTWVHVTTVDSFLVAYQRYGAGHLGEEGDDRYVAEMAVIAKRLGATDVPMSLSELDAWMARVHPELTAGRQAKDAVRFLLAPPLPLAARAPYALITAAAVGLLPNWARQLLWLPTVPGMDAMVVRPACTATLRMLGWALTPSSPKSLPSRDDQPSPDDDIDSAA